MDFVIVLTFIVAVLTFILVLASAVTLFFVSLYLIKLREFLREFASDLVDMIAGIEPQPLQTIPPVDTSSKTWDQKYEEDLIEAERRRARANAGLVDLPAPTSNYGVPPAANPEAQKGLQIYDGGGNMR